MRRIHPAQGFIVWLKSFLLNPDVACDPAGMVTTLCSHKAPKVLGSIPQLSLFQRRRSREQKGMHLSYEGGQKIQALACEPTSCKFDLASVLLSCPKYLLWRTPEGQQTLFLRRRPVQPMETVAQERSAPTALREKSDGPKDKELIKERPAWIWTESPASTSLN